MPFIRISIAGTPPSAAQVAQLQAQTTALMAEVLGKRAEVTVVAVETSVAVAWSVAGQSLNTTQQLAQMEAFITAGTNTAQEKAAFIAAAHQMLCAVLETALSPAYVTLIEVAAENWGYDGQTQAARWVEQNAL